MERFTVIICDDEELSRVRLAKLMEKYVADRKRGDIRILTFANSCDKSFPYDGDFYLLDIVMPNRDGLELCSEIRKHNTDAKIVFCTSSVEFAVEAYDLRAAHYLVKPITEKKFFDMLDELLVFYEPQNKHAVVTKECRLFINVSEIVCLEYSNHKIRYLLANGSEVLSVTSRTPFSAQIAELTGSGHFFCPHQAFLVNIKFVEKFGNDSLIIVGGHTVPIAKLKRAEVKRCYMNYLSELKDEVIK